MNNRITPEFVNSLNRNEIFVFGCRNSGRHFDGASAFALKHFGAVMGQREGRQGQSYAIPTIGGKIWLNDIRNSVNKFINYATQHPELHFLVTPIGCGGGGWSPSIIAPLFFKASKLSNVSLPNEFWQVLNKCKILKYKEKLYENIIFCITKVKYIIKKRIIKILGTFPQILLYKVLSLTPVKNFLYYEDIELGEGMSIVSRITIGPQEFEEYIVNHIAKRAYVLRDYKGRFRLKDRDIDWHSTQGLPEKVMLHIHNRETPYSSGILSPGFKKGVACIFWTVSPDGKTYYLDKWDNGPQTDEKEIALYGFIDTRCRVVVIMQVISKDNRDLILSELRKQAELHSII